MSEGAEGQLPPSCVSSLIPCAAYVNSTGRPPETCCEPLRQAVDADQQCLCAVLNDKSVLKAFNVTTDEAFRLAKSCAVSQLTGCSGGGDGSDKGDAHKANWIGLSSFTNLSLLLFWCSAMAL
ncbi:hypothetical protein BHE74_00053232 [Ensete ventricosum]|nr:hypothetical protein BHE74_00053232 [Ensete ventricosum]RZS12098.1 hypothetical protein BHM03_00043490 [Ensete ventricosum]